MKQLIAPNSDKRFGSERQAHFVSLNDKLIAENCSWLKSSGQLFCAALLDRVWNENKRMSNGRV